MDVLGKFGEQVHPDIDLEFGEIPEQFKGVVEELFAWNKLVNTKKVVRITALAGGGSVKNVECLVESITIEFEDGTATALMVPIIAVDFFPVARLKSSPPVEAEDTAPTVPTEEGDQDGIDTV